MPDQTTSVTEMSEGTQKGLPPGTLVLHSPWQTEKDSSGRHQYIGTVSDPIFNSCTYMNELNGVVPTVIDHFLSFSDGSEGYWTVGGGPTRDPALSNEETARHRHSLVHGHNELKIGLPASDQFEVDDDDGGSGSNAAKPHHDHQISLDEVPLSISENIPGTDGEGYPPHNPLHYEVSAYHIDPTQDQYATVPAGTIVFSKHIGSEGELSGWQRMDKDPLKLDYRETDRSYRPSAWKNVALRIAGCIPSKKLQGRTNHSHDTPFHSHESGKATNSEENSQRVDVKNNRRASYVKHTHDVSYVSESSSQVAIARNLRRHLRLPCFIAKVSGAQLHAGMLVPFIPRRGSDDLSKATSTGLWKEFSIESAKADNPVMVVARDVRNVLSYDPEKVLEIEGKNEHTHDFNHHHMVDLGQAQKTNDTPQTDTGDEDYSVASGNHKHDYLAISDLVVSSENINPLQYRCVFFLERAVDS